MGRFEYKTTVLPFRNGLFRTQVPDIQPAIAREADQGWQLKEMAIATNNSGGSQALIAVFERPR